MLSNLICNDTSAFHTSLDLTLLVANRSVHVSMFGVGQSSLC